MLQPIVDIELCTKKNSGITDQNQLRVENKRHQREVSFTSCLESYPYCIIGSTLKIQLQRFPIKLYGRENKIRFGEKELVNELRERK